MEKPPTFLGKTRNPVPTLDPEDLRTAYDIFQDTPRHNPGGRASVSVDVSKSVCKPGASPGVLKSSGNVLPHLFALFERCQKR